MNKKPHESNLGLLLVKAIVNSTVLKSTFNTLLVIRLLKVTQLKTYRMVDLRLLLPNCNIDQRLLLGRY